MNSKVLISICTLVVFSLTAPSAFAGSQCPKAAPTAYTGDLKVQSKYDQTDATSSTVSDDVDSRSKAIRDYLNRFSSGLSLFSDYYVSHQSDSGGAVAIRCMHEWLGNWASEDALITTETSQTGVALRVWALSSIASAVLKLEHFAGAEWTLSQEEKAWIARLGNIVRADHENRIHIRPDRINNHDYWAAWAVAASAIVTEQTQSLSWSYTVFRFAMNQTVNDSVTGTAYLPNELGRGRLGAHYTQFALTPLVMLADHLPAHGYTINYQDTVQLKKLADFAAVVVMTPSKVAHLLDYAQRTPTVSSFTWLYPFNATHTDIASTQQLLQLLRPYIGSNHRLGGDIRPLYE